MLKLGRSFDFEWVDDVFVSWRIFEDIKGQIGDNKDKNGMSNFTLHAALHFAS